MSVGGPATPLGRGRDRDRRIALAALVGLALLLVSVVWFTRTRESRWTRVLSPAPGLADRLLGRTYGERLDRARNRLRQLVEDPEDSPRAHAVLERLLDSPEASDRAWTLSLLVGLDHGTFADLLVKGLGDADETVVIEAQRGLLERFDDLPELVAEATTSPDPKTRSRALGVIGQAGPGRTGPLRAVVEDRLADPDVEVRWEAVLTLSRIAAGDRSLVDTFLARLPVEQAAGASMVAGALTFSLMLSPADVRLLPLYENGLRSDDLREVDTALTRVEALGPLARPLRPLVAALAARADCRPVGAGHEAPAAVSCAPERLAGVLAALDAPTP